MVQLNYFGDNRDFFKYGLITSIFEANLLERYVFIPMLTKPRENKEGNKKPVNKGDKSSSLFDFIMVCKGKSLDHWETWLFPHVLSYQTVKPADEIFFCDESRIDCWPGFKSMVGAEKALVFIDPNTGLETGTPPYRKRQGPEKYILNHELKDLFSGLHPESLLMIYQHLSRDKREHTKATQKKLRQTHSVCEGSFIVAYREDDLAFVFMAKTTETFRCLQQFLSVYHQRSKNKYKEIVQLHNNSVENVDCEDKRR